eukprot:UN22335
MDSESDEVAVGEEPDLTAELGDAGWFKQSEHDVRDKAPWNDENGDGIWDDRPVEKSESERGDPEFEENRSDEAAVFQSNEEENKEAEKEQSKLEKEFEEAKKIKRKNWMD